MSVLIGHASINENGKAHGGVPGDQTGKEVCIRSWYNKEWDVLLRPKKMVVALESAKFCKKCCENDHIGYDQDKRNTLYFKLKEVGFDPDKIVTNVSTDCSALMTACAIAGGAKKLNYTKNAPTTRTMINDFVASGEYEAFTDPKYLKNDDYLEIGDILLSIGHHTVMVLTNGKKVKNYIFKTPLYIGKVTAEKSICIRRKPCDGAVIGYLYHDDIIYIYEIDPNTGWYNIAERGEDKWVTNNYVEVDYEKRP